MIWIVDASIAVKWFIKDEQQRELALPVLERLRDEPYNYAVPDLFYLEVGAVLLRKTKGHKSFVYEAIKKIGALGIQTLPSGGSLLFNGIDLAAKYGLSLYDSMYVALAEALNGVWLTVDQRALLKLPKVRARDLSEWQ